MVVESKTDVYWTFLFPFLNSGVWEYTDIRIFTQAARNHLLQLRPSLSNSMLGARICKICNILSLICFHLYLNSFTPYSRGNLTFSVLTPEPNHRPGYNDFYNTPSLQEFVKATQVRIHLRGQYHTNEPWVNFRHRYYGVNEVTVSGR